jgi:hypothetical protein
MNGRIHGRSVGWIGAACGAVLLAAGCGGGGGGGGGTTNLGAYTGTTTPAAISGASALAISGAAMSAYNFTSVPSLPFIKPGGAEARLGEVLGRFGIHLGAGARHKDGEVVRGAPINETCGGGGDVTGSENFNANGVGTVSLNFNGCSEAGVLINGTYSDTVTTDTGDIIRGHDTADLMVTFAGEDLLLKWTDNYDYNGITLTDRYTSTTEFWSTTSDVGFRLEGMDETYTFADDTAWVDDCAMTAAFTGRIFDSTAGYVNASTTGPLGWTSDDCAGQGPSSGGPIVLVGDASGTIRLTPQSGTAVEMAVDGDGDAVFEDVSSQSWATYGFI